MERRAKARGNEGESFNADRDHTGEGHEGVNRVLETAVFDRNAGCGQPIGVRLPFVVQRIAAGGHDQCGRQPRQIAAEEGRGARVARLLHVVEIARSEELEVAIRQEEIAAPELRQARIRRPDLKSTTGYTSAWKAIRGPLRAFAN